MTPNQQDDSQTVILPLASGASAAASSRASADDADSHALPPGTVLGDFELTDKIGEGGFSIVYLAWDRTLERKVALKEYMPSSIAGRKGQTQVSPRSERHRDTFDAGLRSFINEAKLLARFDHPSLVKVFRFWEANGTAYMVMPFYEGVTLRDTLLRMAQPPDEDWLLGVLGPLTEALAVIHAENCFHRDVAPDNVILLNGSGKPLLLDFGAARRVVGDMTQALTVILKPGYAPVEQYAEIPDMKQGAWTDVYALAATFYWAITRTTPPPAVGRLINDAYKPAAEQLKGRYSEAFLQALDRALVVRPEQRTASIGGFRQDLGLPDAEAGASSTQLGRTVVQARQGRTEGPASRGVTQGGVRTGAQASNNDRSLAPGGSRLMLLAAGALGVLAAGGAGAWWLSREAPKTDGVASTQSAPASTGTQIPAAQSAVAQTPIAPAQSATAKSDNPLEPANNPPPTPVAFASPGAALDALMAGRDESIAVQARLDVPSDGSAQGAAIAVRVPSAGHLYVLARRPGDDRLYLLKPSSLDASSSVASGETRLPLAILDKLPAGDWHLALALAAQAYGLPAGQWEQRGGLPFSKDIGTGSSAATAPVIGAPSCPAGSVDCKASYGAVALQVTLPLPVAESKPPKNPARELAQQSGKGEGTSKPRNESKPDTAARANKPAGAKDPQCAVILQRMSLGDTSPELLEKMKALHCQ